MGAPSWACVRGHTHTHSLTHAVVLRGDCMPSDCRACALLGRPSAWAWGAVGAGAPGEGSLLRPDPGGAAAQLLFSGRCRML